MAIGSMATGSRGPCWTWSTRTGRAAGRAAAAAGLAVVPGLDMLVHQAAEQVRLMTGREAPLQAMLAAGRQAVSR